MPLTYRTFRSVFVHLANAAIVPHTSPMKRALSIWSLALGLLLVICTYLHLLIGVPPAKRSDFWNDWRGGSPLEGWQQEAMLAVYGPWADWSPGYKHVVITGMVLVAAGLAGLAVGRQRSGSLPSSL